MPASGWSRSPRCARVEIDDGLGVFRFQEIGPASGSLLYQVLVDGETDGHFMDAEPFALGVLQDIGDAIEIDRLEGLGKAALSGLRTGGHEVVGRVALRVVAFLVQTYDRGPAAQIVEGDLDPVALLESLEERLPVGPGRARVVAVQALLRLGRRRQGLLARVQLGRHAGGRQDQNQGQRNQKLSHSKRPP